MQSVYSSISNTPNAFCNLCSNELSISYVCPKCSGRFCKEHKRPENHNCMSKNKSTLTKENNFEQNLKKLESDLKNINFLKLSNETKNKRNQIFTQTDTFIKNLLKKQAVKPEQPILKRYAYQIAIICSITIIACISSFIYLILK